MAFKADEITILRQSRTISRAVRKWRVSASGRLRVFTGGKMVAAVLSFPLDVFGIA